MKVVLRSNLLQNNLFLLKLLICDSFGFFFLVFWIETVREKCVVKNW